MPSTAYYKLFYFSEEILKESHILFIFYEKLYLCCYGSYIFYSVNEGIQNKKIFESLVFIAFIYHWFLYFSMVVNVKLFYICLFYNKVKNSCEIYLKLYRTHHYFSRLISVVLKFSTLFLNYVDVIPVFFKY